MHCQVSDCVRGKNDCLVSTKYYFREVTFLHKYATTVGLQFPRM